MSETKKLSTIQLDDDESNLVIIALGKLQAQATKISKGAETLNANNITKSTNDYCKRIETLKEKFL